MSWSASARRSPRCWGRTRECDRDGAPAPLGRPARVQRGGQAAGDAGGLVVVLAAQSYRGRSSSPTTAAATARRPRRTSSPRPSRVRVRPTPNRGKGGAVRQGVLAARGHVILFADADLGVPAHFAAAALATIDGGADVATGERSLRTYASEERSITRLVAGLAVQISRRVLGADVRARQSMRLQGIASRHRRRDLLRRATSTRSPSTSRCCTSHAAWAPRCAVPGRDLIPRRLDVRRAQAPAEVPGRHRPRSGERAPRALPLMMPPGPGTTSNGARAA